MPIIWDATIVKTLRTKTRHTQETLAKALGVSRVTVSNWESGFKAPSLRHQRELDRVAEAAGVSERQLRGN